MGRGGDMAACGIISTETPPLTTTEAPMTEALLPRTPPAWEIRCSQPAEPSDCIRCGVEQGARKRSVCCF